MAKSKTIAAKLPGQKPISAFFANKPKEACHPSKSQTISDSSSSKTIAAKLPGQNPISAFLAKKLT